MWLKASIAILLASTLLGGAWGLVQYGKQLQRAENAAAAVILQDQVRNLEAKVRMKEDLLADKTRKNIETERARINAINTVDHQTSRVQALQKVLDQTKARLQAAEGEAGRHLEDGLSYRIFVAESIERVWNEGRSCGGLPESDSTGVLQKRLQEVTGDDINRLITQAQAAYCSCGLKYNELWRHAERMANLTQKKPALE